eukprot:TRINITY_DN14968_c0_g1_i1.p1 TRINITY_DN14968_c0_g1~~TRINITY_DN14968_c0_g1_i1.p1  ORF type:complete len:295 (+),score=5.81 TRINITY_DN14968_c0_g1_i1:47-886(+)
MAPLLAFGVARLVLTKAVDYQEHASEYGVHWNFFFTLAFVNCLSSLLPLTGLSAALFAIKCTVLHQILLSATPLTRWLERDERDVSNLLDANREGLCSLLGYAALHYFGSAAVGTVDVRRSLESVSLVDQKNIAPKQRLMAWSVRYLLITWLTWVAISVTSMVQPVSRRFANASYIFLVVFLALIQLGAALIVVVASHLILHGTYDSVPNSIRGLSRNQLIVFVVANGLTGLVNLYVDTLRAPDASALLILIAYSLAWWCTGLLDLRQLKSVKAKEKRA